MADPTITLTVSGLPTASVGTSKVEETPVSLSAIGLTVSSSIPNVSSVAAITAFRSFLNGVLLVNPNVFGCLSIDNYSPKYWFQWGTYFTVDPLPGSAADYTIITHQAGYPLSALGSTSSPTSLPDEFQPLLIDFACYVLSLKLRKWKQAARFYNTYVRNLNQRRQEYINRKAEKRAMQSLPTNVMYADKRQWQH
jgi:hypothetical protein